MSHWGRFFLVLSLSVAATIIVALMTEFSAALMWSGLILNGLGAIMAGQSCRWHGSAAALGVGVIALICMMVNACNGIEVFSIYSTIVIEAIGIGVLIVKLPVKCNHQVHCL